MLIPFTDPGETPVIVDAQGRVIRSPETEAEIASLRNRIATLENEIADARKVPAQRRAEREPQPSSLELKRINIVRLGELSTAERSNGTVAKIKISRGCETLTNQQSRALGLFLLAASFDDPAMPVDVCSACMGQGSHVQSGIACPHCKGSGNGS